MVCKGNPEGFVPGKRLFPLKCPDVLMTIVLLFITRALPSHWSPLHIGRHSPPGNKTSCPQGKLNTLQSKSISSHTHATGQWDAQGLNWPTWGPHHCETREAGSQCVGLLCHQEGPECCCIDEFKPRHLLTSQQSVTRLQHNVDHQHTFAE